MLQLVLKEVSERVAKYTGFYPVNATLDGEVLAVECDGYILLRCNLRTGVVFHGRVQHVGFHSCDLSDLKIRLNK